MSIRHARQVQGGDARTRVITLHALERFKERIKQTVGNIPNKKIRRIVAELLQNGKKVVDLHNTIVIQVGGKYGIEIMYLIKSKSCGKVVTIFDEKFFQQKFGWYLKKEQAPPQKEEEWPAKPEEQGLSEGRP